MRTRRAIQEAFRCIEDKIRKARLSKQFNKAPTIATFTGPAVCVEVIVRKAVEESGVAMDWAFYGSGAVIFALAKSEEEIKKARSALFCALPKSNLDCHGCQTKD